MCLTNNGFTRSTLALEWIVRAVKQGYTVGGQSGGSDIIFTKQGHLNHGKGAGLYREMGSVEGSVYYICYTYIVYS